MNEKAIKRIRIAHTGDLPDTRFSVSFINTFEKEWKDIVRKFQKLKSKIRCNTCK